MTDMKSAAILDKYLDYGTYLDYQSVKDENISENSFQKQSSDITFVSLSTYKKFYC